MHGRTMIKRPKIAIIGAGGNVGAAVAQWAAQKELGDLVLIDIKAGPAEGRALDLTQCSPWEGFNNTSFIATDKSEAMAGADVVVMTAGVPRKPGQSREELININAGIVKGICGDMKKHAPDCVLIVVSNPLDAMVFVAKQVTGFPRERVIGSAGVLDSRALPHVPRARRRASASRTSTRSCSARTPTRTWCPIVSTATDRQRAGHEVPRRPEKLDEVVENTKKGGATLTGLIGTSAWLAPGAGTALMVEADRPQPGPRAAVLGRAQRRVRRQGRVRRRAGQAHGEGRRVGATSSSCRPPRRRRSARASPRTPS